MAPNGCLQASHSGIFMSGNRDDSPVLPRLARSKGRILTRFRGRSRYVQIIKCVGGCMRCSGRGR